MARILLAGRDDEYRQSVADAIRQLSKHQVVECTDGTEALAQVVSADFDLVLLDVQLRGVDGFEVCRRIRADDRTQHTAVVFVTATKQEVQNRLRGLELGAADFIVHPIDRLELLARIGSVLRSKALADEVRRHNHELASKVVERTRQLEELASELRLERDILRETFDVFDEGLLLVDAAGKIQLGNSAGRKLMEGTSGEDGAPLATETLAEVANEAIERNTVCDRSLSCPGKQLAIRAYPAAGGRALLYVRDVTEERGLEMRRLQSEKLASIGMLAAGVAHEINNPASFVLANVESLAGLLRSLDDKVKVDLSSARKLGIKDMLFEAMTIVQESKEGMARIHRIVRDLHSFSRVDDGDSAGSDVNAAVESALSMLRNELRYRTTLDRALDARQPVRGSAARLGQVFLNLIINAAHALPESNLKRNRLQVRSFDDAGQVVVEVEDNGPGISSEVMPHIFESFFTTKPPGLGTGLGLPISREIVRSLGGDVTAENAPGGGALFRVRLPAMEGALPERPRLGNGRVARRRRIVAIDDEALLLKAYRRMLIDHHDIETRLGAREALRTFEEDRNFAVVLCDLQMPEMSGAELYSQVKRRWPDVARRFIFITGGAFSPEARRFLDESVPACINKPFQLEELLQLIETRVTELAAG